MQLPTYSQRGEDIAEQFSNSMLSSVRIFMNVHGLPQVHPSLSSVPGAKNACLQRGLKHTVLRTKKQP